MTAEAQVTAVNGKLVDFEITARDGLDQIGRGTHRRAIIGVEKFAARLQEKAGKLPEAAIVPTPLTVNSGHSPACRRSKSRHRELCAVATLNRPAKLNAVNVQMTADWEQLNAWLAGHREIRVVILAGAGTAFCAGDDVPEVGTLPIDVARELSWRQPALSRLGATATGLYRRHPRPGDGGGCVARTLRFSDRHPCRDLRDAEIKLGWPPVMGWLSSQP